MTAGTLADADAVATVLARVRADPQFLASYGSAAHASGLNEAPYPHLRIRPGGAGSDRSMRWDTEQEVLLETIAAPDGTPGQAALWRLHRSVVALVGALPRQQYGPSDAVIGAVRPSVTTSLGAEPVTGQPMWRTGVIVTIHPPVAIP